ncbi:hypothetical protein ACFSUS_24415 [Spirosoma soli]|uniref:Uncharacterized protein n=1 Tax=Spirosoma soli TaxID=1770529 RepID=A0ABW5MA01_9BACT
METTTKLLALYFAVSNPINQTANAQKSVAASCQYGSYEVRNLKHGLEFLSAFKALGWRIHQAWLIDVDGFRLTIPPEHIDDRLMNQLSDLSTWQHNINSLVFHSLY